jgi:hypothetical protein
VARAEEDPVGKRHLSAIILERDGFSGNSLYFESPEQIRDRHEDRVLRDMNARARTTSDAKAPMVALEGLTTSRRMRRGELISIVSIRVEFGPCIDRA